MIIPLLKARRKLSKKNFGLVLFGAIFFSTAGKEQVQEALLLFPRPPRAAVPAVQLRP